MRLAIPGRVQPGIVEPKVGGEIDDVFRPAPELWHDRLRCAMRKAKEHDVGLVDQFVCIRHVDHVWVRGGKARIQISDCRARL